MKFIKGYNNFKESILIDLNIQSVADILESLSVDDILKDNNIKIKDVNEILNKI